MENTFAIQNYTSLAALVVLLCEFADTFQSEVEFIWRSQFASLKISYLILRYCGLLCQIVNNTIAFTWLSTPPESAAVCMAWQAFLSSSFTVVYFTIEAVLMMRVYYLYNCSTRVKNWLITQVSIEILLLAALKARGYGVVDYGPSCYAYNTWSPIVFGPVVMAISQTVIMALTFLRRSALKGDPENSAVMNVVLQDGGWTWFVYFALLSVIPSVLVYIYADLHLLMSWPQSLLSLCCCRLILNISKAVHHHGCPFSSLTAPAPVLAISRVEQHTDFVDANLSHRNNSGIHIETRSKTFIPLEECRSVPHSLAFPLERPRSSLSQPNVSMKTYSEQSGGHLQMCASSCSLKFDDNSLHQMPSINITEGSNSCNPYPEIEISSLRHSNPSMDSEEWREFWNEVYDQP